MRQNQINEHPSGYLVMDTCCFLNYIEGKKSEAFDYDDQGEEIRQWVKDQISAKK